MAGFGAKWARRLYEWLPENGTNPATERSDSGTNGTKISIFAKRTGEMIENKGSGSKNEPERTEKRSGEVVENIGVHKYRTGTNRKTNRAILLKINNRKKQDEIPMQYFLPAGGFPPSLYDGLRGVRICPPLEPGPRRAQR